MNFPTTLTIYNQKLDRVTMLFPLNLHSYSFTRKQLEVFGSSARVVFEKIVERCKAQPEAYKGDDQYILQMDLTLEDWQWLLTVWNKYNIPDHDDWELALQAELNTKRG